MKSRPINSYNFETNVELSYKKKKHRITNRYRHSSFNAVFWAWKKPAIKENYVIGGVF
jgi:hypothetical protein